ncbi:MAG: hypothetical protein WA621_03580 [Candidatus Acidiferrum sp.]
MATRGRLLLALVLLFTCLTIAESKKKATLPAMVVKARTAIVLIDPNAGIPINAPLANTTAQDDVEKAILKWGRLSLAPTMSTADLVITVRKGNGKIVNQTIGGVPTNDRPVVVQPTDSGIHIGAQQGHPPDINQPQAGDTTAHPETEVGSTEDAFVVYEGGAMNPNMNALDRTPAWRYQAKDALHSPEVPAVDVFRKAIEEAEKQQQQQQQKQQSTSKP